MKPYALLVLAAGIPALFAQQAPMSTTLKVGDMAPDFTLLSTPKGEPVKLSDYRGKNNVVLAFFPAAFTGG